MQSEKNKQRITIVCEIEFEKMNKNCVKKLIFFICLRIDKIEQISKSVLSKIFVFIIIEFLHVENEIFTKINLNSEKNTFISKNKSQSFSENKRNNEIDIIMHIQFETKPSH